MTDLVEMRIDLNIKGITKDEKVWKKMKRNLSTGRYLSSEVGWFRGNKHSHPTKPSIPTAQIAKWNEEGHFTSGMYGVHYVPPRPFIRFGFMRLVTAPDITDFILQLTHRVAIGDISWRVAYTELGKRLQKLMEKAILMDNYVSNTQFTIELKGHSVTLIDSLEMLKSVESRVGRGKR